MNTTKKTYLAPACEVMNVSVENMMAVSVLDPNGGNNGNITPGDGTHDGDFNANDQGDWNIW